METFGRHAHERDDRPTLLQFGRDGVAVREFADAPSTAPHVTVHAYNAALAAWGLAGFDVLTERLGFSLVVGGAARAAVRLPRLTLEVVGDYRFRNFDDLMDPTAPGPNRWVPRLRPYQDL